MKYHIVGDLEHPRDIGADEQKEMLDRVNVLLFSMGFAGGVQFGEAPEPPDEDYVMGELFKLAWGNIEASFNELLIGSSEHDPAGFRAGSVTPEPIVGLVAFDHIRGDKRREALALILGMRDERYRSLGAGNLSGGIRINARKFIPGTPDDGQMKKVAEFHSDRIEIGVEGQEIHLNGPIFVNGRRIL